MEPIKAILKVVRVGIVSILWTLDHLHPLSRWPTNPPDEQVHTLNEAMFFSSTSLLKRSLPPHPPTSLIPRPVLVVLLLLNPRHSSS